VNGFAVHNCRCTFSYVFAKKPNKKLLQKTNVKPKFRLQQYGEMNRYKVEIPYIYVYIASY